MKVSMMPHFTGNPYQGLLAEALRSVGSEVELHTAGRTLSGSLGGTIPDVLHLHWIHPFTGGRNALTARLRAGRLLKDLADLKAKGVRIVWTVHNISDHEGGSGAEMDTRRSIASVADRIIVHTRSISRTVAWEYGVDEERISIIRHGNYVGVHPNDIGRLEARERLGIDPERRVFLFFGFIRPYKGLDELIDVFKDPERKDDLLMIAGRPLDDKVGKNVEETCSGMDNVDLHLGYVEDADIQVHMNAADFLVLPFRKMLTSGSIVLGASFSKPIIAPGFGFVREILDDEGSIIYPLKGLDGLPASIAKAASIPADRVCAMGEHNMKLVENDTWERVAESTVEVYRSVLN